MKKKYLLLSLLLSFGMTNVSYGMYVPGGEPYRSTDSSGAGSEIEEIFEIDADDKGEKNVSSGESETVSRSDNEAPLLDLFDSEDSEISSNSDAGSSAGESREEIPTLFEVGSSSEDDSSVVLHSSDEKDKDYDNLPVINIDSDRESTSDYYPVDNFAEDSENSVVRMPEITTKENEETSKDLVEKIHALDTRFEDSEISDNEYYSEKKKAVELLRGSIQKELDDCSSNRRSTLENTILECNQELEKINKELGKKNNHSNDSTPTNLQPGVVDGKEVLFVVGGGEKPSHSDSSDSETRLVCNRKNVANDSSSTSSNEFTGLDAVWRNNLNREVPVVSDSSSDSSEGHVSDHNQDPIENTVLSDDSSEEVNVESSTDENIAGAVVPYSNGQEGTDRRPTSDYIYFDDISGRGLISPSNYDDDAIVPIKEIEDEDAMDEASVADSSEEHAPNGAGDISEDNINWDHINKGFAGKDAVISTKVRASLERDKHRFEEIDVNDDEDPVENTVLSDESNENDSTNAGSGADSDSEATSELPSVPDQGEGNESAVRDTENRSNVVDRTNVPEAVTDNAENQGNVRVDVSKRTGQPADASKSSSSNQGLNAAVRPSVVRGSFADKVKKPGCVDVAKTKLGQLWAYKLGFVPVTKVFVGTAAVLPIGAYLFNKFVSCASEKELLGAIEKVKTVAQKNDEALLLTVIEQLLEKVKPVEWLSIDGVKSQLAIAKNSKENKFAYVTNYMNSLQKDVEKHIAENGVFAKAKRKIVDLKNTVAEYAKKAAFWRKSNEAK